MKNAARRFSLTLSKLLLHRGDVPRQKKQTLLPESGTLWKGESALNCRRDGSKRSSHWGTALFRHQAPPRTLPQLTQRTLSPTAATRGPFFCPPRFIRLRQTPLRATRPWRALSSFSQDGGASGDVCQKRTTGARQRELVGFLSLNADPAF